MTTDPQTADEATPVAVSPAGANETAASVAAPPTTEQTALRERIEEALLTTRRTDYEGAARHGEHRCDARCALCAGDVDALADAVLAVLPAPADRAATLREAADAIDAETRQAKAHGVLEPDKYRPCRDASAQLRRLADEAEQAGGPSREATEWLAAAKFVEAMNEGCDNRRPCESCTTREDVAAELRRGAAEPQPETQTDEEPIAGAQQCGHDDYHDPHQWADRPEVWCPGWSFADDVPAVSSRPGTEQEA